ncbi:hypothetical protein V2W30_41390 (plasmid) [Streptomyces sp. Q6]|uniref:Uncharacterized protein n=1 Tax=Streptomyces citrinus TaxID=3118173 RepID=A0ACD5ARJ3_9ACTN
MRNARPVAAYSLVLAAPARDEQRAAAPVASIGEAAARAADALWLSGQVTRESAQAFARLLTEEPVGDTLRHAPTGFRARIEWAGQASEPAPGTVLRITKPRTIAYGHRPGDRAESWEVRTHGATSLRTLYLRWLHDGSHDGPRETVMSANGSLFSSTEVRHHRAGDVHARTVYGSMPHLHTVVALHQIAPDAPTDCLILP